VQIEALARGVYFTNFVHIDGDHIDENSSPGGIVFWFQIGLSGQITSWRMISHPYGFGFQIGVIEDVDGLIDAGLRWPHVDDSGDVEDGDDSDGELRSISVFDASLFSSNVPTLIPPVVRRALIGDSADESLLSPADLFMFLCMVTDAVLRTFVYDSTSATPLHAYERVIVDEEDTPRVVPVDRWIDCDATMMREDDVEVAEDGDDLALIEEDKRQQDELAWHDAEMAAYERNAADEEHALQATIDGHYDATMTQDENN
jgi:hypothetical protein